MSSSSSFKSHAALFWVLSVFIVSIGYFIYLIMDDKPIIRPKFEMSYFQDEAEIVETISKNLVLEFRQNEFYWIGIEPGKNEHIDMTSALIKKLKTLHNFQKIIVDEELSLNSDVLKKLGASDIVLIKENLYSIGEKIQELEKEGSSYILVTASIYTNSFLSKNPLHILKEKFKLNPLTFSLAYFATTIDDEKNMVFGCRTDDQTGTSEWGCVTVSRARFVRKKISTDIIKPWLGLMDLSSEKDYILMLKKK